MTSPDLAQREVLDVEQDGDLALALRQRLERAPELGLGLGAGSLVFRVGAGVSVGQRVDALDGGFVVGDHERVQRGDVRDGDVVLAATQVLDRDRERGGQLLARRAATVKRRELVTRLGDVALPTAQRARRPVEPAQLVEHGAVDAGPDELLERRALLRVVAVDRRDQGLEAAGDEVVDLAACRQLTDLLEDDVLDERREGHDQPVPDPEVAGRLVFTPQREGIVRRHAVAVACGRRGLHAVAELLRGRNGPSDEACIGR